MKKWLPVLIIFFLVACGNNNDEAYNNNKQSDQPVQIRNTADQENDTTREESEKISKHLANLAASVPDVKKATALALGDYAVVAIDVDKDLDRSKVGTIKYSVAEALKDDPHGKNAVIVADPDLYARIQEMGEEIRAGKPLQGILNELAEIVSRIMPEIPSKMEYRKPEQEYEEPNKEMNKKDQKQFEKNRRSESLEE